MHQYGDISMSVEGNRMAVPVFEEYEPPADCPCPGCARQRRELALRSAVRAGGPPAAHAARRALVLFAAAGVVLGGGTSTAGGAVHPMGPLHPAGPAGGPGGDRGDPDPAAISPQGAAGGLHGRPRPGPRPGPTADPTADPTAGPSTGPTTDPPADPPPGPVPATDLPPITRADIINRAKRWVAEKVPYSMEKYWSDGYRQDCSGYVSMAWNLPGNEWTGSLHRFATRIERQQLEPGDILLFHNPDNPTRGSHVTIFGGWTDHRHTHYVAYEQTKPETRRQVTPLAYWKNSDRYVPYRYNGLITDDGTPAPVPPDPAPTPATAPAPTPATQAPSAFPGADLFGPGAQNGYVARLGGMLIARGATPFYRKGPSPKWGEADRRATKEFQRAQGWRGNEADGLPGPHTWRLLAQGKGRDIASRAAAPGAARQQPPYPGRSHFRPGRSNPYVEMLGRRLVQRGYGRHYRIGPAPHWSEADRRNVQDFQRAQGWRGGAANGYPGPETWRRLFR